MAHALWGGRVDFVVGREPDLRHPRGRPLFPLMLWLGTPAFSPNLAFANTSWAKRRHFAEPIDWVFYTGNLLCIRCKAAMRRTETNCMTYLACHIPCCNAQALPHCKITERKDRHDQQSPHRLGC
jgi:hypothetical protein